MRIPYRSARIHRLDWKQAVTAWRALPEAEKQRLRWEAIPRHVAASMAFAGEPVSLEMLEQEHARSPTPPTRDTRG